MSAPSAARPRPSGCANLTARLYALSIAHCNNRAEMIAFMFKVIASISVIVQVKAVIFSNDC
jgi:hypothetical protein